MNEEKKLPPLELYPVKTHQEIEEITKRTGGKIKRVIFCGSSNGDAEDEGQVHYCVSEDDYHCLD